MSDCESSTYEVYATAQAYVAAGLSVIPILSDGSKQPASWLLQVWDPVDNKYHGRWGPFSQRLPEPYQLAMWFSNPRMTEFPGLAIICGAVSGGLEAIDFDRIDLTEPWAELVEQQCPGLLDKLVVVQSPRPGAHLYFRSPAAGPNQKLAQVEEIDPETGDHKVKTLIETKGEGGYVLAPPSPPECHPTGRSYEYLTPRDLTQVAIITAAERDILLDAARAQNRYTPSARSAPPSGSCEPTAPLTGAAGPGATGRPGDDFNQRGTWEDVLVPAGWTFVTQDADGRQFWRRPGKVEPGYSATVNYEGSDLLYVFSQNAAPFEEKRSYTKFHAFAVLYHGGDYQAAARDLAARGYGSRRSGQFRRQRPAQQVVVRTTIYLPGSSTE